uniref:Uncharacterized protein n=1 Tax=Cacopsylla melanoneura TaxID=428564 RepID=A0A8D8YZ55_9HEMI
MLTPGRYRQYQHSYSLSLLLTRLSGPRKNPNHSDKLSALLGFKIQTQVSCMSIIIIIFLLFHTVLCCYGLNFWEVPGVHRTPEVFPSWMLFSGCFYSTFRTIWAVPNTTAFWRVNRLWFPGSCLIASQVVCEIRPVAPITTGITTVFIFHKRWISIWRSLYFKRFSASFCMML